MSNNLQVYQFKVYLKDINPMIWRRFLIQNNRTLKDLHYAIQILMGWTDYHLNEFIIKGRKYTVPNMIAYSSSCGEYGSDIKLEEFNFKRNEKFLYSYDFTAGWEFEVRLETIEPPKNKKLYPICISGSGASPDEECGGPDIFSELKDYWSIKAHICISGSGASPDEECGGPDIFSELKDYWSIKAHDILIEFLTALVDEKNSDNKMIDEVFNRHELREASYWLNIHKYERKEVNKFLTLYAKGDDSWQEAFAEVIYL